MPNNEDFSKIVTEAAMEFRRRASDSRDTGDVEVTGPFGIGVRAHGKDARLVMAIIIACAAVGYLFYQHDKSTTDNMVKLEKKIDEMVWVMSRPEKEREKLNLAMPDSLREKLRQSGVYNQ